MAKQRSLTLPIGGNTEEVVSKNIGSKLCSPVFKKKNGYSSKSPLRYPGGKNRAVKNILPILLSNNIKKLCSPFLGGASIELACADNDISIYGYDIFEPLVDFWQVLINEPHKLASEVRKYYPLKKEKFYLLQKTYSSINNQFERAVIYFVLNRCSFSGTTLSGGMSPNHPRFTPSSIDRLENFKSKNFYAHKADFKESIEKHKKDFLYLDPPYANGQSLYGNRGDIHKGFNHHELKEVLSSRDKWVLSYNDCEFIRQLYKDYRTIELDWTYGMNSSKKSNEIMIVSDKLAE